MPGIVNAPSFREHIIGRFGTRLEQMVRSWVSEHAWSIPEMEPYHDDFISGVFNGFWVSSFVAEDFIYEDDDLSSIPSDAYPIRTGMGVTVHVVYWVAAELTLRRGFPRTVTVRFQVEAKCVTDACRQFDCLTVAVIRPYHLNKEMMRLSSLLIPIVTDEDLERIAVRMLLQFAPGQMMTPGGIDPVSFARSIGLAVMELRLSPDGSKRGEIFFKGGWVKVYTKDGIETHACVPKNTIVIDPDVSEERKRFTIFHECAHWFCHAKAFAFLSLLFGDSTTESDLLEAVGSNLSVGKDLWHMEHQAKRIAACLNMNRKSFMREVERIQRELFNGHVTISNITTMISELAIMFKASKESVKIRLAECGIELARGAFNYVEGTGYVEPFDPSGLARGWTICISPDDLLDVACREQELFELMDAETLVYADGHLVLNDPRYVLPVFPGASTYRVTEYGRMHPSECMLVFSVQKAPHALPGVPVSMYGLFQLEYREVKHGITYLGKEGEAITAVSNDDIIGLARQMKNSPELKEARCIASQFNFGDGLGALMKCKGWVVEKGINAGKPDKKRLAAEIGCDARTVQRWLDNDCSPEVDKLFGVAFAMDLHQESALRLFELAGINCNGLDDGAWAVRQTLNFFGGYPGFESLEEMLSYYYVMVTCEMEGDTSEA